MINRALILVSLLHVCLHVNKLSIFSHPAWHMTLFETSEPEYFNKKLLSSGKCNYSSTQTVLDCLHSFSIRYVHQRQAWKPVRGAFEEPCWRILIYELSTLAHLDAVFIMPWIMNITKFISKLVRLVWRWCHDGERCFNSVVCFSQFTLRKVIEWNWMKLVVTLIPCS